MNAVFWIVEICSTFTEFFLCTIFCGTFIDNIDLKNNFRKRIIVSVVISAIMLIINHINIFSYFTAASGFVLMTLTGILVYPKKPLKSPILGIIYLFIIAAIDNIVINTISFALKIPLTEIYQKMTLYRVLAIISSKTLLLLVVIIINKLFSKKRTLQRKYLLFLFSVTTILFFCYGSDYLYGNKG